MKKYIALSMAVLLLVLSATIPTMVFSHYSTTGHIADDGQRLLLFMIPAMGSLASYGAWLTYKELKSKEQTIVLSLYELRFIDMLADVYVCTVMAETEAEARLIVEEHFTVLSFIDHTPLESDEKLVPRTIPQKRTDFN